MRENRLTTREVTELIRLEALTEMVLSRCGSDVNKRLLQVLACDGTLPEHIRAATRKWQCLADLGIKNPTLADAGVDLAGLKRWYEARLGPGRYGLQMERGSVRLHLAELLAEYITEQHDKSAEGA